MLAPDPAHPCVAPVPFALPCAPFFKEAHASGASEGRIVEFPGTTGPTSGQPEAPFRSSQEPRTDQKAYPRLPGLTRDLPETYPRLIRAYPRVPLKPRRSTSRPEGLQVAPRSSANRKGSSYSSVVAPSSELFKQNHAKRAGSLITGGHWSTGKSIRHPPEAPEVYESPPGGLTVAPRKPRRSASRPPELRKSSPGGPGALQVTPRRSTRLPPEAPEVYKSPPATSLPATSLRPFVCNWHLPIDRLFYIKAVRRFFLQGCSPISPSRLFADFPF